MRFWGKTKYGEKKTSREKLICGVDSLDGDNGETGLLLGEGVFSKKAKYSYLCYHIAFAFSVLGGSTVDDVCG